MLMLWVVCAVVGMGLFYLTLPQQKLLLQPLALRPWRALGVVLMLVGVLSSVSFLPVSEAFIVWLLLMLLLIGLLPLLPALWQSKSGVES